VHLKDDFISPDVMVDQHSFSNEDARNLPGQGLVIPVPTERTTVASEDS
jgi:hypothetical protein